MKQEIYLKRYAMEKNIDDFIKELQRISPEKRKLPLTVVCPNGMRVYPTIKRLYDLEKDNSPLSGKGPDEMLITWG